MTFSVATWNINSIAAHERQVLNWLEQTRPTVLALQETQCSPSRFPTTGFRQHRYEIVCAGDGGTNGVAIASLKPLSHATRNQSTLSRPQPNQSNPRNKVEQRLA